MPKVYASWRDYPISQWRWPDFNPRELACRGSGRLLVVPEAMDRLQTLRDTLGKPMMINSAYRSPEHNRAVGGAPASRHLAGLAFDVRMDNHDPETFIAAARRVGFNGIGTYPRQGFVHVDQRAARASWGDPFPQRTRPALRPAVPPAPAVPDPAPEPEPDNPPVFARPVRPGLAVVLGVALAVVLFIVWRAFL